MGNRSKKEHITWQNSGVDCERIYNDRLRGMTWEDLATICPVSVATLPRIISEWALDNGRDALPPKMPKNGIICEVECVDRGRVQALWNARWNIRDIAIDCRCTENCVKEVINEINRCGQTNRASI